MARYLKYYSVRVHYNTSLDYLTSAAVNYLETYQILPWMFPLNVYKCLKMAHKTFPLNSYDLTIHRTNHDQFKNLDIQGKI